MSGQGNTFLTPDEIEVLTGYTRKADQRRELMAMGIKFMVNHTGRPIVMKAALLQQFGITPKQPAMPDLGALEAVNGQKT